jgi:hypothetical protein
MMLSSILDIGSFFIGMIINLLLVTLMCYYFKKKYESLEEAQNEQAKILYELLRAKNSANNSANTKTIAHTASDVNVEVMDVSDGSDDESDSESESAESDMEVFEMTDMPEVVSEVVSEDVSEVKVIELETPKTETTEKDLVIEKSLDMEEELVIEESNSNANSEDGFSKMSMKQLRDILTEKGVKVKPSMKKNELVELAKL